MQQKKTPGDSGSFCLRSGSSRGNRTPVSALKGLRPNRWTMGAALRKDSGNVIRTRVSALRGLRPSPLDDTAGIAFRLRNVPTPHRWGHNIARQVEKDNGRRRSRGGRQPNEGLERHLHTP